MRLDDDDIDQAEQLTERFDPEDAHRGKPDSKSDVPDEQWRDTLIRGAVIEALRACYKASIETEGETEHPYGYFTPENVANIYAYQHPWRAPYITLEFEELPEYANHLTETATAKVRTKPGLSLDETAVRFQVREAR